MKRARSRSGHRTSLDVKLESSALAMDEVVVVGYGTIKKADLSGSIASVGGDKLSRVRATSVSQALQGSMSGVQVTRTGSMPGAGATIRVRGITTIGRQRPARHHRRRAGLALDGCRRHREHHRAPRMPPRLRSTAPCGGRRGARDDKRAKEGSLNIEYAGNFGMVKHTRYPSSVDYRRYMEITNETTWNDGGNLVDGQYPVYSKEFIDNYEHYHRENPNLYPITDWKRWLINDSAPTMKHNITMSYGNKSIRSMATVGYNSVDALYDHRSYEQITARINNDLKITKWLSASINASYRRNISKNTVVNPLTAAYLYAPLWTPVWTDGPHQRRPRRHEHLCPYALRRFQQCVERLPDR